MGLIALAARPEAPALAQPAVHPVPRRHLFELSRDRDCARARFPADDPAGRRGGPQGDRTLPHPAARADVRHRARAVPSLRSAARAHRRLQLSGFVPPWPQAAIPPGCISDSTDMGSSSSARNGRAMTRTFSSGASPSRSRRWRTSARPTGSTLRGLSSAAFPAGPASRCGSPSRIPTSSPVRCSTRAATRSASEAASPSTARLLQFQTRTKLAHGDGRGGRGRSFADSAKFASMQHCASPISACAMSRGSAMTSPMAMYPAGRLTCRPPIPARNGGVAECRARRSAEAQRRTMAPPRTSSKGADGSEDEIVEADRKQPAALQRRGRIELADRRRVRHPRLQPRERASPGRWDVVTGSPMPAPGVSASGSRQRVNQEARPRHKPRLW